MPSFAVTSCSACLTRALARWLRVQMYGSIAVSWPAGGRREVRRLSSWAMIVVVAETEDVSWPILGVMARLAVKQALR